MYFDSNILSKSRYRLNRRDMSRSPGEGGAVEEEAPDTPPSSEKDSAEEPSDAPDEALAEQTDIEALRIARKESRTVLDEQVSLLNDIDDKAMRSVRTAVIFVGIVISAIQVSGGVEAVPSADTWVFRFSAAGVGFLIVSMVSGILTYSVSSASFGVSRGHREDVMLGYSEREWLIFVLNEYDEWTEEMETTNKKNSIGLHTTLFSLVSGLVCLLLSLIHDLDYGLRELAVPPLVGLGITLAFAGVLYLFNA